MRLYSSSVQATRLARPWRSRDPNRTSPGGALDYPRHGYRGKGLPDQIGCCRIVINCATSATRGVVELLAPHPKAEPIVRTSSGGTNAICEASNIVSRSEAVGLAAEMPTSASDNSSLETSDQSSSRRDAEWFGSLAPFVGPPGSVLATDEEAASIVVGMASQVWAATAATQNADRTNRSRKSPREIRSAIRPPSSLQPEQAERPRLGDTVMALIDKTAARLERRLIPAPLPNGAYPVLTRVGLWG
jgi:hypothetical protein